VIVDDEPPARRRLSSLLSRDPSFEIVATCPDGKAAIERIADTKPDIVFLDVQMPGIDGFAVLSSIPAADLPYVIFVTAYDEHALHAFDVGAIDYLLKPFSRRRFEACLERVKNRLVTGQKTERSQILQLLERKSQYRDHVVVRSQGNLVFLRTAEVEWIVAAGNYVDIHVRGRVHKVREKISDFEHRLPPHRFLRVHRSIIVNIDSVAEIQSCGPGEHIVLLRSGRELPLGRSYRDRLHDLLQRSE